jgi:uncharacterized protein (DUF927 family)
MKNFYEKILPSKGVYCVTAISGGARNHFCESLDQLLELIESLKSKSNVFFAVSTFQSYSRKADNAVYVRSFFVDLDTGEGKPYASKVEAASGLDKFLETTGLPPPVMVDSGNGIHAYWPLGEDIPVTDWQPYAEKFKAFCISQGLGIDPVVTADVSRVLRCPGTYNFKTDPPPEVLLLSDEIYEYSFESFKEFLGELEPETQGLEVLPYADDVDDGSLSIAKHIDDFEHVFSDIVVRSLEGSGCNQIKKIIEEAKTLPEPLWYAGLSVAIRCVDGETAIHEMSSDYEGYSREETISKANQSLREAAWAHGCDAFARENPAGCEGCPWRGKISSPIRLGRKLKEAIPQAISPEDSTEEGQEAPIPQALPPELKPFILTKTGGLYYQPPPQKDKTGNTIPSDPVLVFEYSVLPVKRVINGPDGDSLEVLRTTPMDGEKHFYVPIHSIYLTEVLKKLLPDNGVYPTPLALRQGYVSDYFHKWATYLQRTKEAEIMRMQMGWTEDYKSFVVGRQEITADGYRNCAGGDSLSNVIKLSKPTGSYEVWRKCAQEFNGEGWEQHAFGLMCGFGSPLMIFTQVSGATVCYMSPDSGVGKTASMFAALSLFSHPKEIAVHEGQATANALTGRYLALKNMTYGLDEISNIHPEALSKVIHNISQGKAKLRMQSSKNAERELEQSSALIAIFTSNTDIYDLLRTYKASPDGEMARIIQLLARKPPQWDQDPTLGPRIVDPFRFNYGHAGPKYIEYIFKVGIPYVRDKITKWQTRWQTDLSPKSEYRFYTSVLSATFAGGELANEAGIIDFDLERIYRVMLIDMIQLRDNTVKLNMVDYKGLITDFFNKFHTGFLILNEDRVTSEPRTEIVGRIEANNDMIYISKTAFKRFLAQLHISSGEFEKAVEKEKILVGSKKMRLSTGWKAGLSTPPIFTYAFKLDLPEDAIHPNV